MNSLILDAAVSVLFLIFLISGFKNGVMRSFLSLAGAVVAGLFAVYFSHTLSKFVCCEFIMPSLVKSISSVISENTFDVYKIFEKLPKFVVNSLPGYGITPSAVNHIINNSSVREAPLKIAGLFSPIIINVLKSVFTVLLFIIFTLVSKFLSRFILSLFKTSLLKRANSLIGAVFGLFKGYVIVAVCMCALKAALPAVQNVPEVLSPESISSSVIFKEIYNNNPVYEFFKKI